MPRGRMEEIKVVATVEEANALIAENWVLFAAYAKTDGLKGSWFVMARHAWNPPQPG